MRWRSPTVSSATTLVESCSPAHRWLFDRKQGAIIRNAVRVPDDLIRVRSLETQPERMLNIVYVGRILPVKNWQTLVTALANIATDIDWQLNVCGDGPERDDFVAATKAAGIDDRVLFSGFVNDVYSQMAAADVLVLPSWSEGMPNVVVEAFALGVPCLLSDIPAHRALCPDSDAAVFFAPDQAEQLTAAIVMLATHPEQLRSMSRAGLERANEYSVDRMAASYRCYYQAVLERHNAAPAV